MADLNYFMDIGYGGGTFTFPITPKFFPSLSFAWKRSGHEVNVIDTVPVHGWFSEADQDAIFARWATLVSIAHNGGFLSFTMRRADGVVFYQYGHATIESLKSNDSDGGHVNHIEFDFLIREERGVTFSGLVNVEHEDEDIKEIDPIKNVTVKKFRRRVLATGVFGKTANAKNFVMALKPTLRNMTRESIRTVNYDGTVEGVWEFDDTNTFKGGWKRWRETTTYMPGIRSAEWYRTSGIPTLIEGGFGESLLAVDGTIERYDENFPSVAELTDFFKGNVFAATEVVFSDRPRIGGVYVSEWDADDPSTPTVWTLTYSYTLAFGEQNPKPIPAPIPRSESNL